MKFFIRVTILAAFLFAVTFLLQRIPACNFINAFAYYTITFFYLLTVLVIVLVSRSLGGMNNMRFVSMITAAMGIKIFASIIFVIAYAIINKPTSILVVVPFFFYYVAFTIIEVAEMLRLNKLSTKNP